MTREREAKRLVLRSILRHEPLPGIDRIVTFPGIELDRPGVVIVDEDGGADLEVEPAVVVVTPDELAADPPQPSVRVLRFLPGEHLPGRISVRVELAITLDDGRNVPIEGLVATFEDADPLTAVEPTHVLAM